MNSETVVGTGIGLAAVLGSIAFVVNSSHKKKTTTPPPSSGSSLASIQLNVTPSTIGIGGSTDIIAFAYDSNGNAFQGASLILFDKSTMQKASMGSTDSNGSVSLNVTFPKSGSFVLYAENTVGSVKSNSVTVTVKPESTCSCCTTYDKETGTCGNLTPSNIILTQPVANPILYMQVGDNFFTRNKWACWINPASGGTCPTLAFGGSPSCLSGDLQLIPIKGKVTDANGNPVCATGSCSDVYTVYFGLSSQSTPYSVKNTSSGISGGGNAWDFDIQYGFYDQSGNAISSVKGDSGGNFTIYLGLTISLKSNHIASIGGSITAPILAGTVSVNAGFNQNPNSPLAVATYRLQVCMYSVG